MARKSVAKEPDPPPGPPMTDAERAELDAQLARMFTKPNKTATETGFYLTWMARDESGPLQMLMWRPQTEDEIRRANFFHDAARGIGAFTKPVKAGKPLRRPTEETALITAILRNRNDNTGYLVYADYLTENGNSQGDYIRLRVQYPSLPPDSPGGAENNRRANELWDAHAEEWFAPLGELGLRPDFFGTFAPWWMWLSSERGVIEEVTIDRPGVLPQNAARLFAAAPFLRKLKFGAGHIDPTGLATVKQLDQIDELDFSYAELAADGLAAILRSNHLNSLKSLRLSGNDIGDAGAVALEEWPGLAKLESLDVSCCKIFVSGVTRLARCYGLANLTTLRIGRNDFREDGLGELLVSPHLGRLTDLELGGARFDDYRARALNATAFYGTLRHLDLDSARFQFGGFEIFTSIALPALRWLKLNDVNLRPPAAGNLAGAAFAPTLEELYLDNTRLGSSGVEALAAGKFPRLTTLDLSRNRLDNRGGITLANAADAFPVLANLRLWDNRLGPDGVAALAGSELLANLTDLDLCGNKIGPAGALALAHSKYLKKLTSLVVDEKAVGKKGKQALLDRFGASVVSFR